MCGLTKTTGGLKMAKSKKASKKHKHAAPGDASAERQIEKMRESDTPESSAAPQATRSGPALEDEEEGVRAGDAASPG